VVVDRVRFEPSRLGPEARTARVSRQLIDASVDNARVVVGWRAGGSSITASIGSRLSLAFDGGGDAWTTCRWWRGASMGQPIGNGDFESALSPLDDHQLLDEFHLTNGFARSGNNGLHLVELQAHRPLTCLPGCEPTVGNSTYTLSVW
jgi:hypothetical protein